MPFRPNVGDTLLIDDVLYSIAEHPAARGMPYGQEGRAAVVYQLISQEGHRALKVFKPRYQVPSLVNLSERLAAFAGIPGLRVCKRSVLTARRHIQLVREHRDLSYAVLMPWVEGPTWMEVLFEKTELLPEQSLRLAKSLVEIFASMEEHGLAHCDLSGPNLMLPALAPGYSDSSLIELVDVEQMYGEELKRPDFITSGSSGYGHRNTPDGLWAPNADRFAGALLISEMLGWCDERVRQAAWGESYFAPGEMQQESDRFKLLVSVLGARWGNSVARLLEQAWESDSLSDCAPFGHWLAALPDQASPDDVSLAVEAVASPVIPTIEQQAQTLPESIPQLPRESRDLVSALLEEARQYEDEGNLPSALATYRELQSLVPTGSGMADELAIIISDLEKGQKVVSGPLSPVSSDDPELAALFDSALAAYRQAEWASAQELLTEVVRRKPDYQRNGREASKLLATAEKRTADRFAPTQRTTIVPLAPIIPATPATPQHVTVQAKEKRGRNWLLVPVLVVGALLLFGGIALFQAQSATKPDGAAPATATLPAIQAQPNGTATPFIGAQPDTAATEGAIADATSTMLTQANKREQATIQAEALAASTNTAQAEQAMQSTSTAQAQIQQDATAQAQSTSQAQASNAQQATAQAQQLAATAQAQGIAIAQATIQAQAQATLLAQSNALNQSQQATAQALQAQFQQATTVARQQSQQSTAQAKQNSTAQAVQQAQALATTQAQTNAQATSQAQAQNQAQQATVQAQQAQQATAKAQVDAQSTAAAQAQQATAQADAQSTVQASEAAQATANAQNEAQHAQATAAAQATATAFVQGARLIYGPVSGELVSGSSEYVVDKDANVNVRDFIVEVRFYNPSDVSKRWNYGLLFRSLGRNSHYRITVGSDKDWSLNRWNSASDFYSSSPYDLPNMNVSASGSNLLRLVARADTGVFYVNDQYLATIGLSHRLTSGSIHVATNMFQGYYVAGRIIRYENFRIWSLDP
ncbi:MAG TPA: hypothetical protein VEW94_07630 [Chloroflexia bacterium]|nr:hypothetical protein [Chloroflexia bacterium]